jgi:hypothetical protein
MIYRIGNLTTTSLRQGYGGQKERRENRENSLTSNPKQRI